MNILILVGVVFIFFVIGRELVCWYWKINRIEEVLKKIEENTRPKNAPHKSQNAVDHSYDADDKNFK